MSWRFFFDRSGHGSAARGIGDLSPAELFSRRAKRENNSHRLLHCSAHEKFFPARFRVRSADVKTPRARRFWHPVSFLRTCGDLGEMVVRP
jgi:hypothetical protein